MAQTKKRYPRVIIFTTPTCTFCRRAKNYLRQRGVPFKDVDVSRDPAAARDMVRRSGQQGVPVLDIGGKIVVGFDRPKIDRLLGLR
ncbi:MAG: NrdH-redoxin [Anaerolineae bacterium]|nr:MAG: NrdH-redoxin [Anaerolineae bacterium]